MIYSLCSHLVPEWQGGNERVLSEGIMDGNYNKGLNEMLVYLFNHVMAVEAAAVITEEFKDITNNDMHIIEAVGIDKPRNMSEIAKRLSVTVGTLTTNMNALEKKGYIVRTRSDQDKRVVYTTLTEQGKKAFYHHRDFHKKMIKAALKGLEDEEKKVLYKCLKQLNDFFSPEVSGNTENGREKTIESIYKCE